MVATTQGLPELRGPLNEAIGRTQDYFLRTQHPDGYWDAGWSGRVADSAADPSNPSEALRDRKHGDQDANHPRDPKGGGSR